MKLCPPDRYLALCRIQGRDWCRYTLAEDYQRMPFYMLACLVQVGFLEE